MAASHVKGPIVDNSLYPRISPLLFPRGHCLLNTFHPVSMETPQSKMLNVAPPVPAYEEFPSMPVHLAGSPPLSGDANAMDIDSHNHLDERGGRATSVLSMDDIEAAQALEGLRAGNTACVNSRT